MDERMREIAEGLGAAIVTELPDVADGAFGAAHYAKFYQERMQEVRQADRATEAGAGCVLEVPVGPVTAQALAEIAEMLSEPGRVFSPVEVARGLLVKAAREWNQELRELQSRTIEVEQAYTEVKGRRLAAEHELRQLLAEGSQVRGKQSAS